MKQVSKLVAAVRRRERMAFAADVLTRFGLPLGLLVAALAILQIKWLFMPDELLWATLTPLPILVGWALLRRHNARKTARRIDEFYGLHDRIGTAVELQKSKPRGVDPGSTRTQHIVELITAEAETAASNLDSRPVVRVRVPAPGLLDGIAFAALALAFWAPTCGVEAHAKTQFGAVQFNPALVAKTAAGLDLALADPLRQNLRALKDQQDVAAAAADRMLEILDALEKGEIDRAEAFEELEKLEESLAEAEEKFEADLEEDPGMLADAIRELADGLQEHEITDEAGEKFAEHKPDEAEESLNESGEQAEQGGSESQEQMRKAMEEAERRLKKAAAKKKDTAKELDEAERRLRREQKREPKDKEEHERRLKRMERRVEELKRKQKQEEASRRKLDELKRHAKDAANKKRSASDRKRSLQKLSRGASQAAKGARQASRMRQARDSLEEAKTFVRRAGKQGESSGRRRDQFRRFSKAAKGQQGKQGKGKEGKNSSLLVEGKIGDGKQPGGQMFMPGQEGQGEGEGERESQGESESDSQGDGDGDGDGQQDGGSGQQPGGDGIGDGSIAPLGDPRQKNVAKRNLHVKARHGKGVSRAEVIKDSGQHGFATEPYRRVYEDYRSFAQSALDNEALPPAKRRAVKRYYQLIQPRE